MRRSDREIIDRPVIEQILRQARLCHLAMVDDGEPYVVPMNYGYRDGVIFLHCAGEGRKLDVLGRNGRVCFAVHVDERFSPGEAACSNALYYRSVIGGGSARLLTDASAKADGLNAIMRQFGRPEGPYAHDVLARTVVIRIDIDWMTGKQSQPK